MKIESRYLPGFYDGNTYANVVEFKHTILDEYNLQGLNPNHIEWLKNNNFTEVNSEGYDQLVFPAGTRFVKLTAGILDNRDCWQRFALVKNPEIKLLLNDDSDAMYILFGIDKPNEIEDCEGNENYTYDYSDIYDWFAL